MPPRCLVVRILFVALSIVFVLGLESAYGIVGDAHTRFDVDRLDVPGFSKSRLRLAPHPATAEALQASPAWLAWSAQHPGWHVTWNTWTRTAHRAFGPGVRLDVTGPLDADRVERASRDFLVEHAAWLGVRADELERVHVRERLGRWYVTFRQVFGGIPVRGGRADLRLGAGGELMLVGADWFPDVSVTTTPRLDVGAALDEATRDLDSVPTDVQTALQIVPLPRDASRAGAPGIRYALAHELRFRTAEPLGSWFALVDAESGTLLLRENRIRFVDVEGRMTADVEPLTPGDPQQALPLRDTRVEVLGTAEFGYTDPDGNFQFTTTQVDAVDVRVRLEGLFARIRNALQGNTTPEIVDNVFPGTAHDIHWDDSNSTTSERDAYYHTLVTHDYTKTLDPDFNGVDYVMPVTVDITTRDCNAWFDGSGINFLAPGERCVNMAQIADVVYHEYGHAVTFWQYFPFAPSGAMHEAFSDYIAATITGLPTIGNGFRGPGTIIRTIDNDRTYPDDIVGQVHQDGLILGGALWDLRVALGAEVADVLWHYARYGLADNFDDYLLDILVTDDDNGNMYDGTPNFDVIIEAFRGHGIGDYRVQITHTRLRDTEDEAKPLTVSADIISIFPLEVGSEQLHYRIDGGPWVDVALVESAPRQFSADIPQQSAGTTIDYYVSARDIEGRLGIVPATAPDTPYTFVVGTDATAPVITFVEVPDRPADADAWYVSAHVTDNLDQPLADVTLDYSLNATTLDANMMFAHAGDDVWSLWLPVGSASLGDVVHYRLRATDGALVPNVQLAPPVDAFSFALVPGWLRDFEKNDASFDGSGDWAWGVPSSGPSAFSGVRLWGTNLAGNHGDNTNSFLILPPVDLSGWTRGALAFRHWYSTEATFDGGRVEISTNGGATWSVLEPNGGYPAARIAALQGPGYDGASGGWQQAEFDLSLYLGGPVTLRLRYASDGGINAPGWSVDDVEVVQRQVLGVPLAVATASGEDAQATVTWEPPAGTSPFLPWDPVIGYHVYRATAPHFEDATRVTSTAVDGFSFTEAGLVNGTVYGYAVTAVYADGESALTPFVEAQPFRAGYASAVSELDIVNETAALDTSITFTNTGTGFLNMNVWLGDPGQGLDDVRVVYTIPDEGTGPPGTASAYELLFTDTPDPEVTPDLKDLEAQIQSGELWLRLTGYRIWGNIATDFTMIVGLDTDTNLGTGDDGFDYFVVMGRFAQEQFGAPAFISTFDREFVGIPTRMIFPPNSAALEVGFPLEFVDSPRRVYLQVLASLDAQIETFVDFAPNEPAAAAWLSGPTRRLEVPAGVDVELPLQFAADVPPAAYEGQLFLETNDPSTPVVAIPVRYRFVSTPVRLSDLAATQERDEVVLRWRARDARDVAAYRVFRARAGGAVEPRVPDVTHAGDGSYTYRERAPQPGRYVYEVAEVGVSGDAVVQGAIEIDVMRVVPQRTFLDRAAPNPFNPTTTLTYGIARAGPARLVVFDARGRRVRTLARNANVVPGYYRVVWDGRDDAGRAVASGVYHARLVAQQRVFSQRLVLLK